VNTTLLFFAFFGTLLRRFGLWDASSDSYRNGAAAAAYIYDGLSCRTLPIPSLVLEISPTNAHLAQRAGLSGVLAVVLVFLGTGVCFFQMPNYQLSITYYQLQGPFPSLPLLWRFHLQTSTLPKGQGLIKVYQTFCFWLHSAYFLTQVLQPNKV